MCPLHIVYYILSVTQRDAYANAGLVALDQQHNLKTLCSVHVMQHLHTCISNLAKLKCQIVKSALSRCRAPIFIDAKSAQ